MPTKKRGRGPASTATAVAHHDGAMEVDTPQGSDGLDTVLADSITTSNDMWTDDQVASLFKGVVRWKPAGMHKHFRMIAISEHLRNHGIDPDIHQHTRIPFIWQKLRSYYNLDFIDERENFDDEESEDRYVEFSLPQSEYMELMVQRAIDDSTEAATSPPELELSPSPVPDRQKKRKRAGTSSRGRAASADDTEDGATDAPSPRGKATRRSKGRTRAASKVEKAETTEDEAEDGDDSDEEAARDEDEEDNENESEEEGGSSAPRSTRAGNRTRASSRQNTRRSRAK